MKGREFKKSSSKKQNFIAFLKWGMSRVRAHTPYKGEKGFP